MTTERRFLVPELEAASEVRISGAEAHHLLHVLRLGPGDEVILFDGRGHAVRAAVVRSERAAAVARVLEEQPSRESLLGLSLAVAVPKGDTMAAVVQKLTELGITQVIPLLSRRTLLQTARAVRKRLPRWRRIAAEACKQSGRSRIPSVEEPLTLIELLEQELPPIRLLASLRGGPLPACSPDLSCLAMIGPEGGWTEEEESAAAARGFLKLGLGPRTLRAETAAIATAAILQWAWGDLRTA